MSVSNGQIANATNFNNAFMSRTIDTNTLGKVDLQNLDSAEVIDLQLVINQILGQLFNAFDSESGSEIRRTGAAAIGNGSATVTVAFSSAMPDTGYHPTFSIQNTVDSAPIFLMGVITAKTVNGFTVTLNAPTDSANYLLTYSVHKEW